MKFPIYRQKIKGPKLDIMILNRALVACTVPEEPYIVISIKGTGDTDPDINYNNHRKAVLRLEFDDTESPAHNLKCITEKDAELINSFVKAWFWYGVKLVLVHCQAGQSRSAGVGAALSKIINGEDRQFFDLFTPNMKVYSTILNNYINN